MEHGIGTVDGAVESQYEYLLSKLDEIWNAFGDDKVGKGSAFERLMASYLRSAPEFSEQFSEVYLWQDWPERGNAHDHGIDIVAKDEINGGWTAIQCKFYDPQSYVSKKDIDSFLAATAKDKFTGRIVLSTAKGWGATIDKQLDGLTVPVIRIGINDLLESKVDWSQINWQEPQTHLPLSDKKQRRRHQKAAKGAVITAMFRVVGIRFSRAALIRGLPFLNVPVNAAIADVSTRRTSSKARSYYRELPAQPQEGTH